ncbi:serine/threonine-protein kinase Nek4 isoform X2 [Patella vulgata]|uniref:serine/threonine-protein kinase Nek4 isoform X2 n=1 Tax=Patella vulgata TaxID=6465 RepID=UPI00217F2E52|nr:serine/threonine-protein kinase Nek4 isoform X2 [Patella vulgata]
MDVIVERKLGMGAFASVYLVKTKFSDDNYYQLALKVMELSRDDERKKAMMRHEVKILRQNHHDNIVLCQADFERNDHIMLVLEYCGGGDLAGYIESLKPSNYLEEKKIIFLAVQIASAIEYLHEHHIIHRDLKPANIFLTEDQTIKVGDLGISRSLESTLAKAKTFIGTPLYMAPEILNYQDYSYKADVWSFGCIFYELMCLKYPFKHTTKEEENILENIREGSDFAKGALQLDEMKRMTAADLHSFLVGMVDHDLIKTVKTSTAIGQPQLPSHKKLIKALNDFHRKASTLDLSSASEENYSDDFESDSEDEDELKDTLMATAIKKMNIQQSDTATTSSIHADKPKKAEITKKKKRDSILKVKVKSKAKNDSLMVYTRGQRVSYNNSDEIGYGDSDETDAFSSNVQQMCKKDIGEEKYERVLSLISSIKDKQTLKKPLKKMLGKDNFKKYEHHFLKRH